MSRLLKGVALVASLAFTLFGPISSASAQLEVSQVDWQTIDQNVRFHVQFHNTDVSNGSVAVTGAVNSQAYGAFLPNEGLIGEFDVPALAPDSFFDVFFDVELSTLPPSAATILPGAGGGGGTAPGTQGVGQALCPPPTFWNGNVDIFWDPPGTASVGYHFGQLQICPGAGPSYVHVILDCEDAAGVSWAFGPGCPGWTVSLVDDDGFFAPGGPAPNPIPAGFWEGWLCLSADNTVPLGNTCSIDLNMTCGGVTSTINVTGEACQWEEATAVESKSWGEIKLGTDTGN